MYGTAHRYQAKLAVVIVIFLIAGGCGKTRDDDTQLGSLLRSGQVHMEKGRYREAVAAFEKAMTLDPGAPEPYIRLALLYEECLRDPLTALRYYRKYQQVEKDPVKREEVQGWIAQLEQVVAKADIPTEKQPRDQGLAESPRGATYQSPSFSSGTATAGSPQEIRQAKAQGSTASGAPKNLTEAEAKLRQFESERESLTRSLDDARGEMLKIQQAARQAEQRNNSLRESYEVQVADLKRKLEIAEGKLREHQSAPPDRQIAQLTAELRDAKTQRDSARADYTKAAEEIARLKEALNAYATTQSSLQKANDELKQQVSSLRSKLPSRTSTVRQYTVRRGDTLKTIAGSPSIYGDSRKWILIYQANRDKVRDPNNLKAGQVLAIPPG